MAAAPPDIDQNSVGRGLSRAGTKELAYAGGTPRRPTIARAACQLWKQDRVALHRLIRRRQECAVNKVGEQKRNVEGRLRRTDGGFGRRGGRLMRRPC